MKNDLISVIVPVYKAEKYLDECVTSIVNQTHRNLEVILVEDGSPDKCPQMCDEWAARDSRIKVIHRQNGGAAAARNAGLEIALGQYIGFVDSDDCIRTDMYEILLLALQNSSKKIANCFMVQNVTELLHPHSILPEMKEVDVEETLNGIFRFHAGTSLCRRLFERSVFDYIRLPEGETNEEFSILIPMTIAAGGMVQVYGGYYFYRPTEGSVTSSFWKKDAGIVKKNLGIMYNQLMQYELDCMECFFGFAIKNLYLTVLTLDIHLDQIDRETKAVLKEHIQILRENLLRVIPKKFLSPKEKIMYAMIIARVFRPTYKLIKLIKKA